MKEEMQNTDNSKSTKKYLIVSLVGIVAVAAACLFFISKNTKEAQQAVETPKPVVEVKAEKPVEEYVARIDISTKLAKDEKPQFIIFVDGSKTPTKRAFWMFKKGIYGSTIQKNGEKTDIVIKVLKDTEIKFSVSGIQKLDKKKKNIPVWVKYTTFTINGEEILEKAKRVWFGKPYTYVLNAKAGQEYKIHAEWQKDSKE